MKQIDAVLRLKDQFSDAMKNAQNATENYGKEWGRTAKKVEKYSKEIKKHGETLSKALTVPLTAVATGGVAAWKELDAAYDTITTKTGATGSALADLQGSMDNVYKQLPETADSVGQAIGEINTQFGLTGTSLENATASMVKFANINGSDVTQSTLEAKAMMDAFGLSSDDLGSVLDAVTKSAQNTGQGVDTLMQAVTKGAPQLRAMGMDAAGATEMIARMNQQGIDSSKALRYLSKAQVVFAKNGKTLSQGMADVQRQINGASSEADKLTIASQYFGTRGAAFMLNALEKGALDFDAFGDAASNAAGAVDQTYEDTLDPIDRVTVAMNKLKLAGAALAGPLIEMAIPAVEMLSGWVQKFTDWYTSLSPQAQDLILKVGLFAAALGPVTIGISKVVSAGGTLIGSGTAIVGVLGKLGTLLAPLGGAITALGAGPFAFIAAAFGGAVLAGYNLYRNWDDIRAMAGSMSARVRSAFASIKASVGGAVAYIERVLTGSKLWKIMTGAVSTAVSFAGKIGRNADGTDYWRGGLTTVNERGGEIMDLPQGTRIYPHDESVRMAYAQGASASNNANVNVSFNGAVFTVRESADIDAIGDAIARKLRLAMIAKGAMV